MLCRARLSGQEVQRRYLAGSLPRVCFFSALQDPVLLLRTFLGHLCRSMAAETAQVRCAVAMGAGGGDLWSMAGTLLAQVLNQMCE